MRVKTAGVTRTTTPASGPGRDTVNTPKRSRKRRDDRVVIRLRRAPMQPERRDPRDHRRIVGRLDRYAGSSRAGVTHASRNARRRASFACAPIFRCSSSAAGSVAHAAKFGEPV